jgi:hypothetical protein
MDRAQDQFCGLICGRHLKKLQLGYEPKAGLPVVILLLLIFLILS